MAPPPVCQALFLSPGLAAGLAGRRDDVFAPGELAGRGVDRHDEVAHAAVAARGADDDLILHGKRCGREYNAGLAVTEIGLPYDLAGLLVGGDHTRGIVRHADDETAPQPGAAVRRVDLFLTRVHAPRDAAQVARAAVDLV